MGHSPDTSAQDRANSDIEQQIAMQKQEQENKLKSLYQESLVAMKSGGVTQYQNPEPSNIQPGGVK